MNNVTRYITGGFQRNELKWYLTFYTTYFWGLIFLAWLSFPAEHHFSILTHTFSFLGSFEDKHNPQWWWIFSIAMVSWGLLTVPVVFYSHARFTAISPVGAGIGMFFLFVGCAGISLVGIFPDAHFELIGHMRWTDIHAKASLMVIVGFIFGIITYGILLLKDRCFTAGNPHGMHFDHDRLQWPYLVWSIVLAVSVYFLVRWEFVYPQWKAAAAKAGVEIGSHWGAALGTRYSFPLWEQIMIYTLFLFLVWFSLLLPGETANEAKAARRQNRSAAKRAR